MKKLKLADMAWSIVAKREASIAVLKKSGIDVPEDVSEEELLNIVMRYALIDKDINYSIWEIAVSNPSIKHCHNCAHLFE